MNSFLLPEMNIKNFGTGIILLTLILSGIRAFSQDSTAVYKWNVSSKKVSADEYDLIFTTNGNTVWQLYAPNQKPGDVATTELQFNDSVFHFVQPFKDSGNVRTIQSSVFNMPVSVTENKVVWKARVKIDGQIPAILQGTLLYSYGKGDEYYPSTAFSFAVPLEGGKESKSRIKIANIDANHPVNPCGDGNIAAGKSLAGIFLLGLLGGLIALITPCVFPLIPLTVSFFTKKSGSRSKGARNAFLYGFSIFLIYTILSIPFHLLNQLNPEILNNISTNFWLNLIFFIIFILFALSFFGLYEIGLPSGLAGKIDSKAGISDLWGIFFMALTLAIVSFSCTGPILGSLLAGAITGNNGATQLSFGMMGFGVGLGLPFALFALFPNWLSSIPKSGGWLGSVKVVLGFIELAMAVKFLSNADLVEQWSVIKREIFIGIWILISLGIVFYLTGIVRFGDKSPIRFTKWRLFFITLFSAITLYLIPGITNTKWARLDLISGFPPPLSYSIYKHPINFEKGVEPLKDYEQAVALAKKEHKPVLIDFTGWACVNCRRMEENVWVTDEVKSLMENDFVVVSLYVDERTKLPVTERMEYKTKTGIEKSIVTIGDKWATFQSENFDAVSQPQYAIISPDEKALTKTKGYTRDSKEFASWLNCGLNAFKNGK
jgi:Thiol:disulfide interchange protein